MKFQFILLLMLVPMGIYAQDDSLRTRQPFKYGLQLSTSMIFEGNTVMINPLITHSNDKHQFEIGPKFFTGIWNQSGLRIGVEGNYRYYPNSKVTRFSSFLFFNSELYYADATSNYIDYWSIPSKAAEVTRETQSRASAIHLGYGVEWRFIHRFYISTDVSAGGFYQINRTKRISDEPALNSESTYDGFGLSARIGVSLGWRLK